MEKTGDKFSIEEKQGTKLPCLNAEKLEQERKKVVAHCLNLECKKEQLHILVQKLSSMTGQRLEISQKSHSAKESVIPFGFKKTLFADELKIAQENKTKIETEILNAREQLKVIEGLLK